MMAFLWIVWGIQLMSKADAAYCLINLITPVRSDEV